MKTGIYEKMKESGISWIGKIPSHWPLVRAKYYFIQTNERGNSTPVLLAASQKYGVCPQDWLEGVVKVSEGTDLQAFKTVHKGDFVISLRSFQGGFEHSEFEGVCSPAYQVFHANEQFDNGYLKYLFKNELFIDQMNSLTVGIREGRNIKYEDFANSLIFIPPIDEQIIIAHYLEIVCARIDEIISEAKSSIEDYKQWKASIIYEAVTKGLDPDVEMKDSGIEWVGKIPETWNVIRLKNMISEYKSGPFGSALITDNLKSNGNILVYTPEHIATKSTDLKSNLYLPDERQEEMKQFLIQPGDIIFPIVGSLGRAMQVTEKMPLGIINQRLAKFKVNEKMLDIDYFLWLFAKSTFYKTFIELHCRGSIIVNITKQIVCDMPVIVPESISEQKRIANYLTDKCGSIDALIDDKRALIEDLEAYKKSLIYEVVTGKRRVI